MSRSLYRLDRFTARRSWVVIRTSDSGGHAPEAISRMGMAPAGNSISMSSFSIGKVCRMGPGIDKRRSRQQNEVEGTSRQRRGGGMGHNTEVGFWQGRRLAGRKN